MVEFSGPSPPGDVDVGVVTALNEAADRLYRLTGDVHIDGDTIQALSQIEVLAEADFRKDFVADAVTITEKFNLLMVELFEYTHQK